MNYGRSFTFMTEDQDWIKKVLLGGLIGLIPIVGQLFVIGYALEVMKNVIAGREVPLPDLGDFGGKLKTGLMGWLISLIYGLPLAILSVCAQAGNILTPIMAESADAETIQILSTVTIVLISCFGCLAFIYGIVMALFIPFAWGAFLETGQFGAAFQLGKIFAMIKKNIGPAIIIVLIVGLVTSLAGLIGLIVCVIGIVFTMFYAQLLTGYLYGSLYKQARTAVL